MGQVLVPGAGCIKFLAEFFVFFLGFLAFFFQFCIGISKILSFFIKLPQIFTDLVDLIFFTFHLFKQLNKINKIHWRDLFPLE